MSKMHVHESIYIMKPIDEVYKYVRDFSKWREWSAWMKCDPEAHSKTDDVYSYWNGKYVGEGEMDLIDESKPNYLGYDMNLLKPFKSKARVWFELKEKDGGTEVSWSMDSNWPWFLFWMKKKMTAMNSMDFKRGLTMLKDMLENGEVTSETKFEGEVDFQVPFLVGYRRKCSLDDMSSDMGQAFGALIKMSKEKGWNEAGAPMAIYTKYDMVNKMCEYNAVLQMNDVKDVDDNSVEIFEYDFKKALKAKHKGDYKHLGNTWSTLMMRAMTDKLKLKKGIVGIEVYNTKPGEVEMKDYDTDVYLILK